MKMSAETKFKLIMISSMMLITVIIAVALWFGITSTDGNNTKKESVIRDSNSANKHTDTKKQEVHYQIIDIQKNTEIKLTETSQNKHTEVLPIPNHTDHSKDTSTAKSTQLENIESITENNESASTYEGEPAEKENDDDDTIGWLLRIQNKDGSWSVTKWAETNSPTDDVLTTAIALLTFVVDNTNQQEKSTAAIHKGIQWLLRNQKEDGTWGNSIQKDIICTTTCAMFSNSLWMKEQTRALIREASDKGLSYLIKHMDEPLTLKRIETSLIEDSFIYSHLIVTLQEYGHKMQKEKKEEKKEKTNPDNSITTEKIEHALETMQKICLEIVRKKNYENEVRGRNFNDRLLLASLLLMLDYEEETLWIKTVTSEIPYLEVKESEEINISVLFALFITTHVSKSDITREDLERFTNSLIKSKCTEGPHTGSYTPTQKNIFPLAGRIGSTYTVYTCLMLK